jgi:trigger factor
VVADLTETPEGGEPKTRERVVLEVGAAENPEAFNRGLAGAKSGGRLEFDVAYPQEHRAPELAGRSVRVSVLVHEVRRKEIPPLNDDLAKEVGDFETLSALRARVARDLTERKGAAAHAATRQSILDKILLANPVVLPDVLVEEEIQHRLEDMVREMMFHGMDPRTMELDWKQLRDRQDEPARKMVHARLVLDAIAVAEGVVAGREEVTARIKKEAERIGENYDSLRARLEKGGGVQALATQMVREKSLDLVTSLANIQNAE